MSKNLANAAPLAPDRDHLTPFNSGRGSPRDAWRLSLRVFCFFPETASEGGNVWTTHKPASSSAGQGGQNEETGDLRQWRLTAK